MSENTFLLISTPTALNAFVTCIIDPTKPSLFAFFMLAFIFLYKFSIKSGTDIITVGFVSNKFGTICFKPWHTAIEHPHAIGSKKPIVDS